MKTFSTALIAGLMMYAVQAHAQVQEKVTSLYSANYCAQARIVCDTGSFYANDQNGRCGCLTPNDYIPAEVCMRARIRCVEGTSFSRIFSVTSDESEHGYVGCGCYSTK